MTRDIDATAAEISLIFMTWPHATAERNSGRTWPNDDDRECHWEDYLDYRHALMEVAGRCYRV